MPLYLMNPRQVPLDDLRHGVLVAGVKAFQLRNGDFEEVLVDLRGRFRKARGTGRHCKEAE